MEIYLAHTQGFCGGVAHAILILEHALKKYGPPLYSYHEIVHNTAVVEGFRKRGVIFVNELKDIPNGSRVIFSAHGVSPDIVQQAKAKNLSYIDATCPLVRKVHEEALKLSQKEIDTIVIGHKNHEEVVATLGYIRPKLQHIIQKMSDIDQINIAPDKPVGYLTQTTLSIDETSQLIERLKTKFPHLISPPSKDICYATQNRQNAVKELTKICDIIIICGSKNSSNTNRLREISEACGVTTTMIDRAFEFDVSCLQGHSNVGISSGASVPRFIVEELIQKIKKEYPKAIMHVPPSPEKRIAFRLPEI